MITIKITKCNGKRFKNDWLLDSRWRYISPWFWPSLSDQAPQSSEKKEKSEGKKLNLLKNLPKKLRGKMDRNIKVEIFKFFKIGTEFKSGNFSF